MAGLFVNHLFQTAASWSNPGSPGNRSSPVRESLKSHRSGRLGQSEGQSVTHMVTAPTSKMTIFSNNIVSAPQSAKKTDTRKTSHKVYRVLIYRTAF